MIIRGIDPTTDDLYDPPHCIICLVRQVVTKRQDYLIVAPSDVQMFHNFVHVYISYKWNLKKCESPLSGLDCVTEIFSLNAELISSKNSNIIITDRE